VTEPALPAKRPTRAAPKPAAPKAKAAAKPTTTAAAGEVRPKTAAKPKTAATPKTAAAAAPKPKRTAKTAPAEAAPSADGLPRRSAAPKADQEPLALARRIVELAEDKKAADIVLLDLGGLTTLADAFVICSGGSERQLDAIADGVIEGMRAEKVRPIGREGTASSHWVLVDFGSVVVHVFTPPERDYYSLEKRWSEARTVLRVQ
jgi:ribosome-associated protein